MLMTVVALMLTGLWTAKVLRARGVAASSFHEGYSSSVIGSDVIPEEAYMRWKQQVLSSGWKMQAGRFTTYARLRG